MKQCELLFIVCSKYMHVYPDQLCNDGLQVMTELEENLEQWHAKDRWGEVGITKHVADKSVLWACS